jgi:hypothetical protein
MIRFRWGSNRCFIRNGRKPDRKSITRQPARQEGQGQEREV